MRVLSDLRLASPEEGLAADEELFAAVAHGRAPPTLRLWRNRRCVVIGRSQDPEAEADVPRCRELVIPVLRRCSGGGAVYHHPGNLNFSLYLPLQEAWGTVRESQLRLAGLLAGALRARWSVEAHVAEGGVYVEGKKISGSAQLRQRALLHHGTLLLWEDELDMRSFLRAMQAGYRPGPVPSRPASVSSLSDLVGYPVTLEDGVEVLRWAYGDLSAGGPRRECAPRERWTGTPLSAI